MSQTNRNKTVDLIRVIAAYGVIAIHVSTSSPSAEALGRFFTVFCVPFFYVAALTYFIVGLKPSNSLQDILLRQWWRLVVPYLIWTVIYFLLLLVKKLMTGQATTFSYWKIVLYGNSAVQLYFVPQLMAMQLLILSIFFLFTMSIKKVFQAVSIILFVIFFLLVGYSQNCFGTTTPESLLTYILGAFCVASIIKNKYISKAYLYIGVIILGIVIVREFVKLPFNYSTVLRFLPISGIGLMFIAICTRISKLPKIVLSIADVSFGIYLCHVFFLESFELIISRIWKVGIKYNFVTKASVALLLFGLSTIFCLLINQFNFTKRLLLGKNQNFKVSQLRI